MAGVLVYCLPYLELTTISQQVPPQVIDLRKNASAWWTSLPCFNLSQSRISIFYCPSANGQQDRHDVTILGLHTYYDSGLNQNTLRALASSGTSAVGKTNYLGCAGLIGETGTTSDKFIGLFSRRSKTGLPTRDGDSNTLMFGEALGEISASGGVQLTHAWFGSATMPVAFGLGGPRVSLWSQFGSAHPGVVQFSFGDASVRGIRRDINATQLQYASGKQDGNVASDL
jgi:hypothetical protein